MLVLASGLVNRRSCGARRAPGRPSVLFVFSALAALAAASCGGDGGNGPGPSPSPQPPTVSAIAPNAGSTAGNTSVRITGGNFRAGAAVVIGGVPASNVTVLDSTTLTAVTGPRSAGAADVVVSVGGLTGTLTGGFTYAMPGPANNPAPVVTRISARGSRPNAPEAFADVDEVIAIKATVTDNETPPDQLVYEWSADAGEISGAGASVTWKAPRPATTPVTSTLSLVVVERYVTPDGSVHENRANRSVAIAVHDSVREVGDMTVLFLEDFSNTPTSPETVIRNFSSKCRGRADELADVRDNRKEFVIDAWHVGEPAVTIQFDAVCGFRARPADACVAVPVRWESTAIKTGKKGVAEGIDHVTAIYDADRWYLCDSDFEAGSRTTALGFKK
jgi:hypothetical protein